ncbi:1,4-dihydroxy-2-naphthoate polyprenyltransferase [Microbacterium aquimaris]|uniref:1,4-dihydroxy-2-naphthoate polyprenyltransferase n=1 Tax=Microbacterium aquimaris TaxID=459816 RepID=UPI002AD53FCF|nr:1,4-dihydroxy-2-naphthoate polyprenyltransferase [Microbacterium aquimaris]MDZ8276812.1 1,4-dihydroxy-2-naphthoate polyprenyltransferase [Microbacterium aquimaris]
MAGTSSKKRKKSSSGVTRSRGNPAAAAGGSPRAVVPVTWRDWVGAARLRTLPLAVTPVLIGTGAALVVVDQFHGMIALACLAVAVFLQIGVNFANDYSDGIRGTDDHRVGPARLTASRRVPARRVLGVALGFFALAAVAGLAIVIRTEQWWMLAVGAVAIAAAWFYTGGKRPYGYYGLGELFVFVFFGLVATLGTTWVQAFSLPQEAWFGAVAAGLLACAVLLANNLRDIDQDRVAGKRTLTVLIGRRWTQVLFTVFVLVPFAIAAFLALFYPIAWLTLLALLAGLPAIIIVWSYREARELVVALALTSLTSVGYGALLCWAFVG